MIDEQGRKGLHILQHQLGVKKKTGENLRVGCTQKFTKAKPDTIIQ